MSITTKNGDGGMTGLMNTGNVSKSDERIQLLGSIDELTSHLGLLKSQMADGEGKNFLEQIQSTLITIMAGVADAHNGKYKLSQEALTALEAEMQRLEGLITMPKGWVLPGGNPLSAQADVARTVARRSERCLSLVTIKFGSDKMAKQYLNRLSDYLFILSRYCDTLSGNIVSAPVNSRMPERKSEEGKEMQLENINDTIVQEVLRRMGQPERISLKQAKMLMQKVEEHAHNQGMKAVIAVCGPDGNPIAVHVMDDAFLVSFDVALKKAYTSASVKMSTIELGELVKPGSTFQGLDSLEGDKMVFFGGGVPLKCGDKLVGALGVSGGTGEEDHRLAELGLQSFEEIMNQQA